jgi:hypothetical protein
MADFDNFQPFTQGKTNLIRFFVWYCGGLMNIAQYLPGFVGHYHRRKESQNIINVSVFHNNTLNATR